jgi:hypothetical protein
METSSASTITHGELIAFGKWTVGGAITGATLGVFCILNGSIDSPGRDTSLTLLVLSIPLSLQYLLVALDPHRPYRMIVSVRILALLGMFSAIAGLITLLLASHPPAAFAAFVGIGAAVFVLHRAEQAQRAAT